MTTLYASITGLSGNNGLTPDTPKPAQDAINAAVSGDTILLANSPTTYPALTINGKTLHLAAQTAPGAVAVPGFSAGHPARKTRGVKIKNLILVNAPYCTFENLWFKFNEWVDTTAGGFTPGQEWASCSYLVFGDAGSHKPIFQSCEFSWGYGPNQEPFNTSIKYPEFQSGTYAVSAHNVIGHGDTPQSWWLPPSGLDDPGTTDTRAYNTIAKSPGGYRGHQAAEQPEFLACHFHDLSQGAVLTTNTLAPIVDQCWFQRIYMDNIQITTPNQALGANAGFRPTRTIFEQFFGNAYDSGNPHGDVIQHFAGIPIADPADPTQLRGFWIDRLFYLLRPEDRAGGQFQFYQGAISHDFENYGVLYTGITVRDCMGIQRDTPKGLLVSHVEDGLVLNNMFVTAPGGGTTSSTAVVLNKNPYKNWAGVTQSKNNIAEQTTTPNWVASDGDVNVGRNYAAISASTLMQGTFPPPGNTTAAWYEAATRQPAYAEKGPRFATLEDLVLAPLLTDNIDPFVGWESRGNAIPGQVQTGPRSLIRGPVGGQVTVSTSVGTFRITDQAGAVVADWGSTPVLTDVGNYVEPRHTASALYQTSVVQNITLTHAVRGAFSYPFSTVTINNIKFPRVQLPQGATPAFIGKLAEANSKKVTLAFRFQAPTLTTGSTHYIFSNNGSLRGPRFRIVATDIPLINCYDTAGVSVQSSPTSVSASGALGRTKTYLFVGAWDTTAGVAMMKAKIHDLTDGTNNITFPDTPLIPDVLIGLDDASGTPALRNINAGGGSSQPYIDFIWMKTGVALDPYDPDILLKFSASFIGPDGQGPTGSLPEVFEVGDAAAWNAVGGLNRGTMGKYVMPATTAVDIDSHPWPPVLDLTAHVETAGPYVIDQPIHVMVGANGYVVGGSVNLATDATGEFDQDPLPMAEGSNGVFFEYTPRSEGTHTITGVHSAGYTSFAPIVFEVEDPYTYVDAGETASLNETQRATVELKTYQDTPINDVLIEVRYKNGPSESGDETGVDYLVDIVSG